MGYKIKMAFEILASVATEIYLIAWVLKMTRAQRRRQAMHIVPEQDSSRS
jgi:hypothetical protein